MFKKTYSARDIEKLVTYVPPLFIVFFTLLSIAAIHIFMEKSLQREIVLLAQKEKFICSKHLDEYIHTLDKQVTYNLDHTREDLKNSVHTLSGIATGLGSKLSIQELAPFIDQIEKHHGVRFVVIDSSMQVLHGLQTIKSIQHLASYHSSDPKHLKPTLLNMISQGPNSSVTWKNDTAKTIQLSYFTALKTKGWHIGAFSSLDNLRELTIRTHVRAMQQGVLTPKGYHFYLYDHAAKRSFNRYNHGRWHNDNNIPGNSAYRPLEQQSLSIGIMHNGHKSVTPLAQLINSKRQEYTGAKIEVYKIIIVVALLLLLFTIFFAEFIRRAFTAYDQQLIYRQKQLKKLKERYELAVIASDDGLWDTNFKTKKSFFSKKWLDMFGYSRGEVTSYEDWMALIHPDDKLHVVEALNLHVMDSKSKHFICEYRLRTKKGSYIWVLGRGKAFVDAEGNPEQLSVMCMNIDARKEANEKLATQVHKEMANNQEKQKLLIQQNKLAAMGEMIGAIAHQWRQPLNNIALIVQFIRDNADNSKFVRSKLPEYVERVNEQIAYMSETIDDFKSFYMPSKNKAPFDVKEAIEATLKIMQVSLEKNNINVELKGSSFMINGYENEFKQAVLNILANAKDAIMIQFQKEKNFQGQVIITLKKGIITICNNGGRAEPEVIKRMFEPYFTTKFEDKGTGIGLYMTKMIIEKSMGGEISAANNKDGVKFTIKELK